MATSVSDALARIRRVMSMKAAKLLAGTCAVSVALLLFGPPAQGQAPHYGGGATP